MLEAPDEVAWDALRERIQRAFGLANFSRVYDAPRDLEGLGAAVLAALQAGRSVRSGSPPGARTSNSRCVRPRSTGAWVLRWRVQPGRRVDLGDPQITIYVEVLHDRILFSFERLPGPGGFPVGSAGRVLALLSGGIDSPVAAWRMMKRGCSVQLVNFHAFPLQDHTMIDKVRDLAEILTRWQLKTRLFLVPFGTVQQTIVASCPAPLRVVLYRRFMLRIAEVLATRHQAKALVTGESLGQVASQTLDNLAVIGAVARLPVLRPLVGMDKDEITVEARRLGSFDVSTLPDQDCCQLFVPRSPALAATLEQTLRAEQALDVAGLVAAAVAATEEERRRFPAVPSLE